jgi:hypothetical protein
MDSLDFHELSVWEIRDALVAAYMRDERQRNKLSPASPETLVLRAWWGADVW